MTPATPPSLVLRGKGAFGAELEEVTPTDRPLVVCLERSDVADAVAVLEAIEDNQGDARCQAAALRVYAHQSGSLITAESSRRWRQGCGLREWVRRVGVEPTTR